MFEVGTKIKIKDDLVAQEKYGTHLFIVHMIKYLGRESIITRWGYSHYNKIIYHLEIDNGDWVWTPEMMTELQLITPEGFYSEIIEVTTK